uniref:tripartite tricarboxylate transporter substrate-binding protein n=1 Tax=Bradyrhizobium algeriense TaxID=634784 RepID=UPI00201C7445
MISRRNVLLGASTVASLGLLPSISHSQSKWPARPIAINIGNAPGGDDDTLSRWLAETMTGGLGQPVVIENRPGGSMTLAATAVASSRPDGYTIFCLVTPVVVQTALRS